MNTTDREVIVTTQLTGKGLKANSLIAYTIIAIGILIVIMNAGEGHDGYNIAWGCLISLYGICHLAVTRIRIWWNHK